MTTPCMRTDDHLPHEWGIASHTEGAPPDLFLCAGLLPAGQVCAVLQDGYHGDYVTIATGQTVNGYPVFQDRPLADWIAEQPVVPVKDDLAPVVGPALPRVFSLVRYDDVSEVSGTGIVAQGVQFRDGQVVLQWCCPGLPSSVAVWGSVEDVLTIHGHHGRTVVKWADGRD